MDLSPTIYSILRMTDLTVDLRYAGLLERNDPDICDMSEKMSREASIIVTFAKLPYFFFGEYEPTEDVSIVSRSRIGRAWLSAF